MRRRSCLCVALFLVAATNAPADLLNILTQTRTVSASASANLPAQPPVTDSESFTAPDFNPFDADAEAVAQVGQVQGAGEAGHTSSIGPNGAQASLGGVANALSNFQGFCNAQAGASFSITFNVSFPVDYDLSGNLQAFAEMPGGSTTSRVTLLTGAVALHNVSTPAGVIPYHFTGTLAPGDYTLTASFSSSASGGLAIDAAAAGGVSMNFVLTPEPGAMSLLVFGILGLQLGRRRSMGFVKE